MRFKILFFSTTALVIFLPIGLLGLHFSEISLAQAQVLGWTFKPQAGVGLNSPFDLGELQRFPWGVLPSLAGILKESAKASPQITSWIAGIGVAVASNLVNNLPMGLIAATTSQTAQVPQHVTGAILIGVDLGPNLSITGSLATILWLIALRREGEHVAAWQFLKLGLVVMPPALLLAVLALLVVSS